MTRSIRELAAAWEAADPRLYPVVLTRPYDYARYLELVRAIDDELAACETVDALVESYGRAAEIAAAAVERSSAPTENLDVGLATGAAFALRYRRVEAAVARREAVGRIEAARDRGDAWVTVTEWGDPVGGPYLRLELHLADGASVQASIRPDAETGDPRYAVEAFRADPRTADRPDEPVTIAQQVGFEERAAWEGAIASLRAAIEEGSG